MPKELSEAEKKEAQKRAREEAQAKRKALQEQKEKKESGAKVRKLDKDYLKKKREEQAAKPKFMAEHTLTADETLSHLSLKYYGSATEPYWRLIYEANKATIGDNPNHVREGLVLNIPELPADMKKD